MKKGIASWILITGSVIIGITIFFIGTSLIMKQMKMSQKQNILEQFQDFYTKIKIICETSGKENKYYYDIIIPNNVRAVYVANSSIETPPDKVSELITNQETSAGNYLCIQFFDDNLPICQDIGCMTRFTYIGTPSLKTTLQTLIASIKGNYPVFEYNIIIEKTDQYFLNVSSSPVIAKKISTNTNSTI